MSVPSSDGRSSTSSMPSITSSPTLNSRYSGAYADNGEGSSSQRPSLAGSRQNSGGRKHTHEEESRNAGNSLQEEAVGERDFAQRKRSRRSGGFLLGSAFSSGPRSRSTQQSSHGTNAKRKQTSHVGQVHERNEQAERHHTTNGTASGSPLSREVTMADAGPADADYRVDSVNTADLTPDGVHVAKTRAGTSATRSTAHDREQHPDAITPRPAFDPTQIVHMALSLNESRRRNLSAGQLLTPQAHATSGGLRDGSFNSPGTGSGHLRQYLNEQRRVSRNISPFGDRSSGRHMSMSAQRRGSVLIQGQQGREPSQSTWRRVEKARAFIELRMEYLRLLEFLPPLKPDSTAPGNFVITANNVPGSPHAQLTRIPSHANKHYELGRPYNPLQVLRNRRSRARERRNFELPPEEFADVEQVHKWVDRVEEAARSVMYRQLDGVLLPKLHEDHGTATESAKLTRPSKIWMFSAEELLADAHWLEHGDNKTIVEDRYGRRIFPPKEPQKQDLLSARASREYSEKRRKSWVEGIVAENNNTTGDESEALSERGRKRRLLPTFRAESPKHKKHWIGSKQQSGSDTDSSDSDSSLEKRRSKKTQKMVEGDNETGALKLRMKHLMEREAKETQRAETPLLFTPDTPNKWGQVAADGYDEKAIRSSFEVSDSANGSARVKLDGFKLPPKQRNNPEWSKDPTKEYRSSFDEFDSTAPSTPLYPRHYPHIDGDSSPPSRANSLKKPKKSKLDFLRHEESKAKHDHDHPVPGSAGSDKKHSSRNASEEIEEGTGIGSAIWAAPGAVKNFLGHRKNDSVNSLTSPIKEKDRRDTKEPPSAVTKFIKGIKNEGSKMGGFIFRKDGAVDESDTDAAPDRLVPPESETDEEFGSLRRRNRPNLARSTTAETAGSVTSKSSKKATGYHLELPSFRSSYQNQSKIDEDSDSELSDHHITRQTRETAKNRSPRFDKLAPPGLDLSRISSNSSPSPSQDRISQLLARPGGVGHAGLPVTSLAKDKLPPSTDISPKRKPSRPTLEGKRHWSITDSQNELSRANSSTIVSPFDIARVRALFLCSGIKAKEINRRALEVRANPPSFLTRAAKSANAGLYGVSKKEEHVLAARILTTAFETRIEDVQTAAQRFREETVVELQSCITHLKATVETSLFARVREGGDEALQVSSRVSADAPLTVKQITDDIEHMMRMRRRRTRWVRRVGWTLLEWALLGFMWCAWLVVTLSRVVGRFVFFFWSIVRWLLWL